MFNDLRGFIEAVQERGECKIIENADLDLEIGSITEVALDRADPPTKTVGLNRRCSEPRELPEGTLSSFQAIGHL